MDRLRPVNLLIIAITLGTVHVKLSDSGESTMLVACLIAATVLSAAAGYIINDIYDRQIDAINSPKKALIHNRKSLKIAYRWYFALLILAIMMSAIIICCSQKPMVGWVVLACNAALWLYAAFLKCTPVLGNLWVAALVTIGPALVIWIHKPLTLPLRTYSYGLLAFIFVSHLFREMVKDVEDLPGDAAQQCGTLPVITSFGIAKRVAIYYGVTLFLMLSATSIYWLKNQARTPGMYAIALTILAAWVLYTLLKATSPAHFRQVSSLIKWLMIAGLMTFVGSA